MNAIVRAAPEFRVSAVDRFFLSVFPTYGERRLRARASARALVRSFEGASTGRRSEGWTRHGKGPNEISQGELGKLRSRVHDLCRNNGWARKAKAAIADNVVGWGIHPRFTDPNLRKLWKRWAERTHCSYGGRQTFYALQHRVIDTIVESGECLIVKHVVPGKVVPLKLEVLEPECLDTSRDTLFAREGETRILQGVEFDAQGQRVAYWLFDPQDPLRRESKRIPAERVIHAFWEDRPGQVRGVTWMAAGIVKLHDFDDYSDALLMRQKIAACFSVFVRDIDGTAAPVGDDEGDDLDTLEPGRIEYLAPGKDIAFATPPPVTDNDAFSKTCLESIAASLGVTYEDLTGDYSQVNFSSLRASRLAWWRRVGVWQWHLMIPLVCDPVLDWFIEAAILAGQLPAAPDELTVWTPPPMPMIDPDKEGQATRRLVRSGAMTHAEMVAQQGGDPETHWKEYAAGLEELDRLGIVLDSDPRKTTDAGLVQAEDEKAAPKEATED